MDAESGEEWIFGNDVDMDDIIWMGPQPSVRDMAAEVGVERTAPFAALADCLRKAVAAGRRVHFLPPYRFRNVQLIEDLLGIRHAMVKDYASLELVKAVVDLRSVKEACEIEEITKAMRCTRRRCAMRSRG